MPDVENKPRLTDRIRIEELYEIEYWTLHFGITPHALQDSVHRVGPMVVDVERDLENSIRD